MTQMSPENDYLPPSSSPEPSRRGMAIASMVLGICGLLAWLLPCIGLPATVTGLILGILSRRGTARGMAVAGIVLCSIGLALTAINAGYGAYLGATGQHPLLNRFHN